MIQGIDTLREGIVLMSDLVVEIRLPESLVKRAKAAGIEIEVQIESQTERLIAALEKQIERAESAQSIVELMDKIDALPEIIKPTPEEIEAEIRAYRKSRASHSESNEA